MRNLTLVFAGIALVATITAVQLWRELRAERLLVAQLQSQPNVREPVPTNPAATSFAPTFAPDSPPRASAASPADNPAAPPAPQARPVRIDQRELLKDPAYRDAMLAQIRLQMPLNYPGLVQELGLSPQEADALFDLLAANQLEQQGTAMIFDPSAPPDAAAMEEMRRARQDLDRKLNESIMAMLGSGRYEQWKEYQQTRPARSQVTQLARTMEAAGQPLSESQTRSLIAAYAAEQSRRSQDMQRELGASGADPQRTMETNMRLQTESNRRLLDAAAPHLSSRQLDTLRTSLEQQLAMSTALARVQREQMQQSGSTATSAPGVVIYSSGPAALPALPPPPPGGGDLVIATLP